MKANLDEIIEELMPTADDVVLIDFETLYHSTQYSVAHMGGYAYTHDPRFDCYLVTVFGRGVSFVGHPKDFDWRSIAGRRWCAHNALFDKEVFERLVELGIVPPGVKPDGMWIDTAALAAYLRYPRNLAGAAELGLGVMLDKSVRNVTMNGKGWKDFTAEEQVAVTNYAFGDRAAWAFWQKFRHQWPAHEQALSEHTLLMWERGVHCDVEGLEEDRITLEKALFKCKMDIPWVDEEDEKGKPVKLLSPRALAAECAKVGVPVPKSTSIKSEQFLEWLDEYGDRVPAAITVHHYRRINRLLNLYKSLQLRLRPDGRLNIGLGYFYAGTGRWAGGGGVNPQNFPKEPMYFDSEYNWAPDRLSSSWTINPRHRLTAPSGKRLGIADLSQIEPRVVHWLTGNKEFLDLCRAGVSPYEAAAITDGVWKQEWGSLKKKNPKLYALYKARVLALGYGAGWRKFIEMAKQYVGQKEFDEIFTAPVTEEQTRRFLDFLDYMEDSKTKREFSELDETLQRVWVNSYTQVSEFRKSNPKLAGKSGLWKLLDNALKSAVDNGTYELELPSGRSLIYTGITSCGGWKARQGMGSHLVRVYGGLLTENLTQAVARDVFGHGILNLEAAGFRVMFHVHDEVIIELEPGQNIEEAVKILTVAPDWAKSLPIAAEGIESPYYTK